MFGILRPLITIKCGYSNCVRRIRRAKADKRAYPTGADKNRLCSIQPEWASLRNLTAKIRLVASLSRAQTLLANQNRSPSYLKISSVISSNVLMAQSRR
jgi:hypothetical protein